MPPKLPPGIKLRTDYVPKAKAQKVIAPKQKKATQLCPRCQHPIPIDELAEHMRIELLDPKWKEQKKRYLEKNKERNILDTSQISENLKRLAEYRKDIFGGDVTEGHKKIQEAKERARAKELAGWDGHIASVQNVTSKVTGNALTMEEQRAVMMKMKAHITTSKEGMGPQVPQPGSSSYSADEQPVAKKARMD